MAEGFEEYYYAHFTNTEDFYAENPLVYFDVLEGIGSMHFRTGAKTAWSQAYMKKYYRVCDD